MTRLAPVLLLAALALMTIAVGCGDSADPPPRIVLTDDGYEPAHLEVEVGARVTFVNRGTESHTAKDDRQGPIDVSPQPGPTQHDGSEIGRASRRGFATHSLFEGEKQVVVFPVAGEYRFYCAFHPDEQGTITVVAGDG